MEVSGDRWRAAGRVTGFLLLLAVLEYALFFRDLHHFFQGDSIYLLVQRASSLRGFLQEFISLGQSGWYRPLGHGLVPFFFFPWFGLEPAGYRIVGFVLFFAVTVAQFFLMEHLTRSRVASAAAAVFFASHTANVYTTYDISFTPELLYTFFYICSVLAYCRRTETHRGRYLAISVLCFIASLLSKEAAVTLPATLILVDVLRSNGASFPGRVRKAIMSVGLHLVVLAAYLVFVVGYLRLESESIATLVNPEKPKAGYALTLDRGNLARNIDQALSWALNIPRGWTTQLSELPEAFRYYLKSFRLALVALAVAMLFDPKRRTWLLLGMAWFLATLSPMLSLRDHFLPYYLFLPLAGFALAVGGAVDRFHEYVARLSPRTANAVCILIFVPLLFVSARIAVGEAPRNGLLGQSSAVARNSIQDLKALYPVLKARTALYFLNDDVPHLWWHQAAGGLFRLHYGDEPLQVSYSSKGELILPEAGTSWIVLKHENGHFRDMTAQFQAQPAQFDRYRAHYGEGLAGIAIEPREVTIDEAYVLTIDGLADTEISIHYVLNDGPVESFSTRLDANGSARFFVSSHTRKGLYRFVGFNLPDSSQSRRSNATLVVR